MKESLKVISLFIMRPIFIVILSLFFQPSLISDSQNRGEFIERLPSIQYHNETRKDSLRIEIDSLKKVINNYLVILKRKKKEARKIQRNDPKRWIFFNQPEPIQKEKLDTLNVDSIHIYKIDPPIRKIPFFKRLFHKKKITL